LKKKTPLIGVPLNFSQNKNITQTSHRDMILTYFSLASECRARRHEERVCLMSEMMIFVRGEIPALSLTLYRTTPVNRKLWNNYSILPLPV
jgi:hypothetical protein